MNIKGTPRKGRTVKKVTIENIGNESNAEILAMAFDATGEEFGRCFGTDIARPALENDAIAIVTIYTD